MKRGPGLEPCRCGAYALRIFWARFRRRIFFLRHFQRCLPGFFQARELRFMSVTVPYGTGPATGGSHISASSTRAPEEGPLAMGQAHIHRRHR